MRYLIPLLCAAACGTPEGTEVGQLAPDFELPDSTGELRQLSEFRGQVLLLEFVAMWCPSCQAQTPEVQQLYEELGGEGFEVLQVVFEDPDRGGASPEEAAEWAEAFALDFPVLADEHQLTKSTYRPLQGLPAQWMLDAEGVVSWSERGVVDTAALREEIEAAR